MTDPSPYRAGRDERPAGGPGQTDDDLESSLPPGVSTRDDDSASGDVDRAMPYTGNSSPERMEEEPFGRTEEP